MLSRLPGALMRAALVILLIVIPYAFLPNTDGDRTQIITLIAIFAALFTIVEYSADSPSLVEFRDAPPFNRLRFLALFATVLCLSVAFRGGDDPTGLIAVFRVGAAGLAQVVDFPYSPVRLFLLMMPAGTDPAVMSRLRDAAGLAYLVSILSVIWFIVLLQLYQWPRRNGPFNVWINLPTFDPTAGGDVVKRLARISRINIILGFLLPFLVPAVIKLVTGFGASVRLDNVQTLIWAVSVWAFLPASIVMRGVALGRVANMIDQQRKNTKSGRSTAL